MGASAKTPRVLAKSEETRQRILSAALALFRERGFEETTMREIAKEAGVALGAAYYYFASKEALVMAFYQQAKDEMHDQIADALAATEGFEARVKAIIHVKFEYFRPNRKFLNALFRHAADPQDPLSPFSKETESIRQLDTAHFAQALTAAGLKVPADLQPHLPGLLWLFQMGIILFWIYDRSPGEQRTIVLLDKSLSLLALLLKLAALPLMRPVRKRVIDLLMTVTGDTA